MSRGLGKIERAVLEALEKSATDLSEEDREVGLERHIPVMDTQRLFLAIHGAASTPDRWAKYNALTRALRSLARKELVVGIRRKRRIIWTDPQGAAELRELEKEAERNRAWFHGRIKLGE